MIPVYIDHFGQVELKAWLEGENDLETDDGHQSTGESSGPPGYHGDHFGDSDFEDYSCELPVLKYHDEFLEKLCPGEASTADSMPNDPIPGEEEQGEVELDENHPDLSDDEGGEDSENEENPLIRRCIHYLMRRPIGRSRSLYWA